MQGSQFPTFLQTSKSKKKMLKSFTCKKVCLYLFENLVYRETYSFGGNLILAILAVKAKNVKILARQYNMQSSIEPQIK